MNPKVLKFYAKWCAPCKRMSPITKEIAEENPEVEFEGVDIEERQSLVRKYEVNSVPTLIFLKNDEEVDRMVGMATKKEVEERVFLLLE